MRADGRAGSSAAGGGRIEHLYGSLPDTLHSDAELQQLILPGHRGDFEIVETYRHTRGDPLPCPATVVGGTLDTAGEQDLAAWRDVLGGPCQVRMLPGDHFYFRPDPQPLLRLLTEILRSHGAAL